MLQLDRVEPEDQYNYRRSKEVNLNGKKETLTKYTIPFHKSLIQSYRTRSTLEVESRNRR